MSPKLLEAPTEKQHHVTLVYLSDASDTLTQQSMMGRPAVRSTVERISLSVLPAAVHRFLFSQSEEFLVAHLVVRALFGAASGVLLFLGVALSLPLTFDLKLAAGCVCVGVCVVGGASSSSFRCSVLLMFPSMLGSRGRAYLMLLILSVLHSGPLQNIQRNVQAAAESLSCNLDLQVHHSRLLWRDAVRPFILITQQLTDDQPDFLSEARSVSRKFQTIRDQVVLQYGYDRFSPKHAAAAGNDTQQQFTAKTMMQCDSVVDQGVARCADWFNLKWAECMEAIPVPVINHILCVSMKFHFLCDVMRVMTPWCRRQLPVEGNFGQLFDQLNASVDLLSREFSSELLVEQRQQRQAVLDQDFTDAVRGSFGRLTAATQQLLDVLQILRSLTFITIFTQAFGYLRRYRRDVGFDNVYVTTYFKQMDAGRKRAGRRCLLPLSQSERRTLTEPWSPKILPEELRHVASGVFQVISVSLLSVVLLTVDFSLFHVLDVVSRHTVTRFNLTSSHQVDIRVGGASMMARLLRKTVAAFNSSSSLRIDADNRMCVSPPSSLPAGVYVSCVCCVLLAALFSCLQVYTNRLRRVIAAFYHPEREKKRVLFIYNLQIQRRICSADRKRIISQRRSRTVFQFLSRWTRRLCHRRRQEASD
ncbi:E3 ubiquitin-protein ligase DCST1 [Thunnus albacares]|uniref:E3 ubiquitin-protein ligase DCST1 n=1 Tax=Thunnus albacares TaxID=8236 RepID=UPI001CF6614A|nr:E3 ubiquitin-protein ligase DCST1 [Thunnus albacares]